MGNSNGKPLVFTDQVNLNHFRLLRVVGKGAFGKVRIVERKDNGDQFALKYIRKDEVVRSESVRNIIRERRMLEHLRHPFLCNLRYSFQDVEYLYLVVDLMTGGDLRFHISRKTFTEDAVQFWIAQLGCAIEYIHSQGIVHRDVKPDNVLLDKDGHVHLADFNVASDFKPDKPLTSKSGTLAYLAPEVYDGKGYSSEVDWWSLGVLFYECIYNKRPFEGHNHELLGKMIIRGEPAFPQTSPPISNVCLHAISSLLEKDRKKRIGAAGFETFSDNPFFRPIDFVALVNKEIEPVFKPSSEKTNFDATYDLEELLLEEAPLEARARRQKPREQLKHDATEAEIRAEELHKMIETLFEPFDYTLVAPEPIIEAGRITPTTSYNSNAPGEGTRPYPIPRSNGPEYGFKGATPSEARSRASTQSPRGSPPLPLVNHFDLQFHTDPIPRSIPDEYHDYLKHASYEPPAPPDIPNPGKRRRGLSRPATVVNGRTVSSESPVGEDPLIGGTMSSGDERDNKRPSGMLGFLSRKKGRDRSPKAKERGVLGKEGARVVINP